MAIRVSLVLNDKEEYKKWKNYQITKGYGNFSQMVRCIVERVIKQEKEPIEKTLEPLKNAIEGLYKLTELTNEQIEIVSMRLANKEGDSEINKAAREILQLLEEEKTLSEINGKLSSYSRDAIDGAIALLIDLGLIGTRRTSSKQKNNSGGKK